METDVSHEYGNVRINFIIVTYVSLWTHIEVLWGCTFMETSHNYTVYRPPGCIIFCLAVALY